MVKFDPNATQRFVCAAKSTGRKTYSFYRLVSMGVFIAVIVLVVIANLIRAFS